MHHIFLLNDNNYKSITVSEAHTKYSGPSVSTAGMGGWGVEIVSRTPHRYQTP